MDFRKITTEEVSQFSPLEGAGRNKSPLTVAVIELQSGESIFLPREEWVKKHAKSTPANYKKHNITKKGYKEGWVFTKN